MRRRLLTLALMIGLTACGAGPERDPERSERRAFAHVLRGVDHALAGRADAAEADLKSALLHAPSSPLIHRRLAEVLLSQGRGREGLQHLEAAWAATEADEDGRRQRRDLAQIALRTSYWRTARALAQRLASSRDAESRLLAARIQIRTGWLAPAEALLDALEQETEGKQRREIVTSRARWLRAAGHPRRALDAYRRALALPEGEAALATEAAHCLAAGGDGRGALALLERHAARRGDFGPEDILLEARLRHHAGQTAAARELIGTLLTAYPEREAPIRLGWARALADRDPAAARATLAPLGAQSSPPVEYYLLAGQLALRSDTPHEARRLWETARQTFPREPLPDLYLAGWAQANGDLEEAERHYQSALSRAADHPEVLAAVGRFLLGPREDPARALPVLEAAAKRSPALRHHLALARGLLLARGPDAAITLLERLLERRRDARLLRLLGVALLARGDRDAALDRWREALALAPDAVLERRLSSLAPASR